MPGRASRRQRDLWKRVPCARCPGATQTRRSSGDGAVALTFLADDAALEVAGGGGLVGVRDGAEEATLAGDAVAELDGRADAAGAPEAIVAAQLEPVVHARSRRRAALLVVGFEKQDAAVLETDGDATAGGRPTQKAHAAV